jgi:hypothetical protein
MSAIGIMRTIGAGAGAAVIMTYGADWGDACAQRAIRAQ